MHGHRSGDGFSMIEGVGEGEFMVQGSSSNAGTSTTSIGTAAWSFLICFEHGRKKP